MWTDNLAYFDKAARRAFDFLRDERNYSGPDVEYGRDYALVYGGPSKGFRILICWERSWYAPGIILEVTKTEGTVWVELRQILTKLGVTIDASGFPFCEKIERKKLPGFREMWIHMRRKDEILLENPRFLEAYGSALRANYGAVLQQVYEEPISIPAR